MPGRIVEAVGGESETELSGSDIAHHHEGPSPFKAENRALGGENGNSTILTHLQSRWTLNPFPYKPPPLTRERRIDPSAQADMPSRDQTEVHLSLSFAFANPIYSAMSSAVTPKVAGIMIEAFEKRVATLLEPGKGGATQTLGKLDGVLARDKP